MIKYIRAIIALSMLALIMVPTDAYAAKGALGGIVKEGINLTCKNIRVGSNSSVSINLEGTGDKTVNDISFIQKHPEILAAAQKVCPEYGLPVSLFIAQTICEQGWDPSESLISNKNLQGIKGNGPNGYQVFETWEEDVEVWCKTVIGNWGKDGIPTGSASFSAVQAIDGWEDKLKTAIETDFAQFLTDYLYVYAPPFENDTDGYIKNVQNIIQQYNLTDCDDGINFGFKTECVIQKNVGFEDIAKAAVSMAYWEQSPQYPGHEIVQYNGRPATQLNIDKRAELFPTDPNVLDCGKCVATAVRLSGADPNYPPCSTEAQREYCLSHPDLWKFVTKGTVNTVKDQLQPGDILVTDGGSVSGGNGGAHTEIYAGNEIIKEAFTDIDDTYAIVSASLDDHGFRVQQIGAGYSDPRTYNVFRCTNNNTNNSIAGGDASMPGPSTAQEKAIVNVCKSTPYAGSARCATWTSNVYQNAGYPYMYGNANDQYYAYCTSSDKNDLKPGMLIAVPSHPNTVAGRKYGHVGIYVGNGLVMDNAAGPSITITSLDKWIAFYGKTYPVKWGWGPGAS